MRGMIMKTDKECIDIMKQGGHDMCDAAFKKWRDPGYYGLDDATSRKNAAEWKATKERISEICASLKKELKCQE
jgi:hypothetical protein